LLSLFGLADTGTPSSYGGEGITITDSGPHAGIGTCAQAGGAAKAVAKIVNGRPYPIDVLYPVGAQTDVPSADPFAQLGEEINNSGRGTGIGPHQAQHGTTACKAPGIALDSTPVFGIEIGYEIDLRFLRAWLLASILRFVVRDAIATCRRAFT
jgi:hypothetical protein